MKPLPNINLQDPLHRAFAHLIEVYEALLPSGHATRVRQMLARGKTVEKILSDWAFKTTTQGLDTLNEYGERTGEHLVIEFADRFPTDVVLAARRKLDGSIAGKRLIRKRPRRGRGSY